MDVRVNDWVDSGKDFKRGLELLKELLPQSLAYSLCLQFNNEMTQELMEEALLPLLKPKKKNTSTSTRKLTTKQIIWNELPEAFNWHRNALKAAYIETNNLRGLLFQTENIGERQQIVTRIIEQDKVRQRIFEEIDDYHNEGVMPVEEAPSNPTIEQLAIKYLRAAMTNRSYIARYKNDKTKQDKVMEKKQELEKIKSIIDAGAFV